MVLLGKTIRVFAFCSRWEKRGIYNTDFFVFLFPSVYAGYFYVRTSGTGGVFQASAPAGSVRDGCQPGLLWLGLF